MSHKVYNEQHLLATSTVSWLAISQKMSIIRTELLLVSAVERETLISLWSSSQSSPKRIQRQLKRVITLGTEEITRGWEHEIFPPKADEIFHQLQPRSKFWLTLHVQFSSNAHTQKNKQLCQHYHVMEWGCVISWVIHVLVVGIYYVIEWRDPMHELVGDLYLLSAFTMSRNEGKSRVNSWVFSVLAWGK